MTTTRSQLNIRARQSQLAFWQGAAELAGYAEFSAWVKDTLTAAAAAAFKEHDRARGQGEKKASSE